MDLFLFPFHSWKQDNFARLVMIITSKDELLSLVKRQETSLL
jgi:hypothetical protein